MAKLYPPNIQGVIPAFYGTTLVVPFSMNRAVSEKEVSKFQLKVKTISGELKMTTVSSYINFEDLEVTFSVTSNVFMVGQFYKIQIAYVGKDGVIGYFSTVGIAKYTTEPEVYIEGLDKKIVNTHIYNYVGVYSQETPVAASQRKDASEKLYSSRFVVLDENRKIYKDSGDIIHNTTKDTASYEATELFQLLEDLESEKIFYIQFQITTVNFLHLKTPFYRIKQRRSINPEQKVKISAKPDFVNGCIDLSIDGDGQKSISGNFIISRSDSKNNFLDWEELFNFRIEHAIDPKKWSAKDYSAEQGVYYKYGIQQYNDNGVYSDKVVSDVIFSDFEDMFLYDGEYLLNVRFNPKVSSFKIDLQENKQDTIGSQFPYIFRNGHVNYKEFSISGLISYLADVDGLFMDKDLLTVNYNNTLLTSENIVSERDFKLKALSWLANGKPKLFKSPTEGNYIVRLMNTSLSPFDNLGRIVHTFTSTAYEIMKYNAENLRTCGMIGSMHVPDPVYSTKTIDLSNIYTDVINGKRKTDDKGYVLISSRAINSISFEGVPIGTYIKLDDVEYRIGSSKFSFTCDEEDFIKKVYIKIPSNKSLTGKFKYTIPQYVNGYFDLITKTEAVEVPIMQFFGNFYNRETIVLNNGQKYKSKNIYDFLQDARTTISKMYNIRLYKRDREEIFLKPSKYNAFNNLILKKGVIDVNFKTLSSNSNNIVFYKDRKCTVVFPQSLLKSNIYYEIRLGEPDQKKGFKYDGYYKDKIEAKQCPSIGYAIDGLSLDYFKLDSDSYIAKIDNKKVSLSKSSSQYVVPNPNEISYLEIGRCVAVDLSYSKMISSYSIEETDAKLNELKENYLNLLKNSLILDGDYKYYIKTVSTAEILLELKNNVNNNGKIESSEILRVAYYNYLEELSKQLEAYKKGHYVT